MLTSISVGQWCFSKSGHKGVCRQIRDCPSGIAMVKVGIIPQICIFQDKSAVICCEDRPSSTATASSSKQPNADTLPVIYPSEGTYTENPAVHFTRKPYASSSEIHGGSKNNQMQNNQRPIFSNSNQKQPNQGHIYSNSNQKQHNQGQIYSNSNQKQPNQGHVYSNSNQKPSNNGQVFSNQQQPNRGHMHSNQNNYFDGHNQLGASQNHNTQGTIASSLPGQTTNTPVGRRISEESKENSINK